MIQAEVSHLIEGSWQSKAVGLASQGVWTSWDLPNRKVSWPALTEVGALQDFFSAEIGL